MASPTAFPHHRHQSSLEGIIYPSSEVPLEAGQRDQAKRKFYHIINYFEAAELRSDGSRRPYNRPLLIRLTYEHSSSEESQDIFLRAFFRSVALPIEGEDDVDFDDTELEPAVVRFAEHLFDNFFLPLKASTKKTPQPSPVYHSAIQRAQEREFQDFVGTLERVSELRGECLIRDRHRCVISRRFDQDEATKRMRKYGDDAKDDDGNLLSGETQFDSLEVAHILPHSLTSRDADSQLPRSKEAALAILNMFDYGVVDLIDGNNIDRPRNAMTVTHNLHRFFGDFEVFFEPVPGQLHTYQIRSFLPSGIIRGLLPVTRTFFLTESRSIDPPLPRLLALHRAIAHILHLSAAGAYIDKILDDMEKKAVRADGSTELSHVVSLKLGGWLDGSIHV
ncbi:hypothetical protein QBC47DRAFT_385899 [Echria macrotheca]|uniref:HNH nuclease domain-containing protein n=1 Tax=Echria macrotheca TaxID=438768 RepID=A0AAJ0BBA6_9PEZI|nr:hypothetical protein QBC47DRAFT_385899 [Echria macrotheca]